MKASASVGFSCIPLTIAISLVSTASIEAQGRNGKLFDPGIAMSSRAGGAPKELDEMSFTIGNWDVAFESKLPDGSLFSGRGVAAITYMNRGHGLMERFYSDDVDGQGLSAHTMSFLTFVSSAKVWSFGEASSSNGRARALSGRMESGNLALYDATRPSGGTAIRLYRRTWKPGDENSFQILEEISSDLGQSWGRSVTKTYKRRPTLAEPLILAEDLGSASPDRPAETAEFDFLLGEREARHWILFGGQEARFPSRVAAVHALGGHALLEFNSYDVDPNLPDAATSILRIFNRAQRRWESIYVTNRFNAILYFGGRKEGDQIVLTNFGVDSNNTINHFVFHDIREDGYRWYAESSSDRGKTFKKNWTIDVGEKEAGSY